MSATEEDRLVLRVDAATTLKRFFHYERALTITCGAWVPAVHPLETKELLARCAWENAMTAHALRERVFELRYPERDLVTGADIPAVDVFQASLNAPNGPSLLRALAVVYVPALLRAYESYLAVSDDIADGPTRRFLDLAVREKKRQASAFENAFEAEVGSTPEWSGDGEPWLAVLGGALDEADAETGKRGSWRDPGVPFRLAEEPGRDEGYAQMTFYWPDNFDPQFPYGDGTRLRVRSAVSHLNEVWAVETAGAILHGLQELGWEFIFDAARWLYDESRHMMMGKRRLERWGFDPRDIPLGTFIYDACRGQEPLYRLGMLAFFETKNIGKKRERAAEFGVMGDASSQRDMDFDWADEAIHAGYGRRWIKSALESLGRDELDWHEVVARCEELVLQRIEARTPEEEEATHRAAAKLLAEADRLLG